MTNSGTKASGKPVTDALTLERFSDLSAVVAGTTDRKIIWKATDRILSELIGHKLFSVLEYDQKNGLLRRCYSSRPDSYPVGGTKKMKSTPWGRQVLMEGRHFLGTNADDIRWAFPDHDVLLAMGLQSALNLPMRSASSTLGTLNLLHGPGHYRQDHLSIGRQIADMLVPSFALADH